MFPFLIAFLLSAILGFRSLNFDCWSSSFEYQEPAHMRWEQCSLLLSLDKVDVSSVWYGCTKICLRCRYCVGAFLTVTFVAIRVSLVRHW